ncbi:MAG TPA: hypothetical protein VG944_17250 [Fimbriimonas sp.]|nr:hypothetical protein [Fimbriimonas sp.]
MSDPGERRSSVTPVEAFRFVREEVKHEYEVLGNRLTSYITSQSFLFASYAVSMSNPDGKWGPEFRLWFPLIVCSVGLLTSYRAQPGIRSAVLILNRLHEQQSRLHQDADVQALDPADEEWMTNVHRHSLQFSTATGAIFSVAWLLMIALATWVYWRTRFP